MRCGEILGIFSGASTNVRHRERWFATDFADARGRYWIDEISQVVLLCVLDGFCTECQVSNRPPSTQKHAIFS